jgi:hypothetical protein
MAAGDKEALAERYHTHTKQMANAMHEASEHIAANSQLDLTPEELVEAIERIANMLSTAKYHAERMVVFARLLDSHRKHELARTANRNPQR